MHQTNSIINTENTKKRPLYDIINNPESITEEEIQDYKNSMDIINDLKKWAEAYDLKLSTNNNGKRLSKRFYQEHFIMAGVLEAFATNNEITFKELNQSLLNYIPKTFFWNMSGQYQNLIISKMIRLGFIVPIKTDNQYNPKFKITKVGAKAFQQQIFQTLASTSFFNYQTYQLSKRANRMNVIMLIVTILSVIVTIVTILK